MSGILCFRNFLGSAPTWSPTVTDNSSTGTADANHPASLLIDNRTDTYFRRTNTQTVILRNAFSMTKSVGMCVCGLIGVESLYAGVPAPVMVRLKVGTTAGASDIYDGYRRVLPIFNNSEYQAPQNAFFVINTMGLGTSESEVTARAIGGSYYAGIYLEWTLTSVGINTDWTVRETTAWSGFAARVRPSRVYSSTDRGDIQLSFGGNEFPAQRGIKQSTIASLIDFDDKAARGGQRGVIPSSGAIPICTANIKAISRYVGTTRRVVFVPDSNIGTSGYTTIDDTTGRDWDADYAAQSEIVYGYLRDPLSAREVSRIDADSSYWETEFSVIEAFNGLS